MKKVLFFLLFVMSIGVSNATDSLRLQDIISKMNCREFSCINDFMILKGYSFSKKESYNGLVYTFHSEEIKNGPKNLELMNLATFRFKNQKMDFASVKIYSNAYCQKLIRELAAPGFRPIKTMDEKRGVVEVVYLSKKYPNVSLGLTTSIAEHYTNDKTENFTQWEFSFEQTN